MTLVLPSTVEELNLLQSSMELPSPLFSKAPNKGFENIQVEKKYKREVSLPNGLENWNIGNFDTYLNILEDNPLSEEFKVIESVEDRLVPEESDHRQRCESFSSVASSMDEKRVVYRGYGDKSFNTTFLSGSTCISSDHSYVSNDSTVFRGLEAEETYQNLDMFLQQVPEININDSVPSPLSSTDSCFDLPSISNTFSLHTTESQDVYLDRPVSTKRPAEAPSEDPFVVKAPRFSSSSSSSASTYTETKRKPTPASKNCRKTRKEKQKEMEVRVTELESEKEGLKVQVQVLEELIQAHKMKLYAILQKR